MTKKSNKTREFVNTKLCCCATCEHSMLHQYGTNPVLADCRKKPQPGNRRFPFWVMVARTMWVCPMWQQTENEKWIQPRLSRTAA